MRMPDRIQLGGVIGAMIEDAWYDRASDTDEYTILTTSGRYKLTSPRHPSKRGSMLPVDEPTDQGNGKSRSSASSAPPFGGCFRCRFVLLDRPCSSCGWFPRPLPPPKRGTHESDLFDRDACMLAPVGRPTDPGSPSVREYRTARDWSRSNAST